ncbi:EAL domain-containing protein [Lacticaseibacillus hulanensis]|uniref:EAL domain-containing protein n=1 Tax=Lacticaseibacillus hulanensis TaxID=2493111 RepID=UPI000FD9B204|nr:EAL domain-containing protein [Lacticaseibacillus hulanensis]
MRFFGQPKYHLTDPSGTPIGYELFVREWRNDRWELPTDFDALTTSQIYRLLSQTVGALPQDTELVSFNLEQSQFINPDFTDMVANVQAETNIKIYTELTERSNPAISSADLVAGARRFHARHLKVCIDDVGTDAHSPALVELLNPYVDEYKFALQNFRPFSSLHEISSKLAVWHDMAQRYGKVLAIEGIESSSDLECVKASFPCDIVQGYHLGRPALLSL